LRITRPVKRILIKSGWLGRNKIDWYAAPDELGRHITDLHREIVAQGYEVAFAGERRPGFKPDLEIHLERQFPSSLLSKRILLYSEPMFIQPQNRLIPAWGYDFTFDWRTDRPQTPRYGRYVYPRELTRSLKPGFNERNLLVSCIAGNKNAVLRSSENLYGARQRYIHLLTQRLGDRFWLYGGGWNLKDHPVGFLSKVAFRARPLQRWLERQPPLPSYRGKCGSKRDVMHRSLFTLCVENSSAPGGISEKLIDCLQFGSVPLYLGPPDVADLVPPELYVDLRQFKSDDELSRFIETYSESDYVAWARALDRHLEIVAAPRRIEAFVDTMVRKIHELVGTAS
jgi:hypothetical protein